MKDLNRLRHSWLLCLPLLLNTQAAIAQDQFVELQSNGGYTSYRLPDDTTQVDLSAQTQGACRFNRTWGYDLTNRELWTNGGVAAASRLPAATPLATAVGPTLAQRWPRWPPSRALRCWPTTTGTTTTGDPSTRTIPARVATGGEKSAWTAACAWTCGVASSSQAPHCRCMNATAPRPSGLLWGAG